MAKKQLYKDDPNWTYESIVKPDGIDFYNRYFYKRKKAHRIPLDTGKTRTLSAYLLIEKDLRNCITWLNTIVSMLSHDERYVGATTSLANTENRELFNIVKGLFVAALTIYGKCYTSCEGRRVKLEKSNLDEPFHIAHDSAMAFRHNFAAHSGAKKYEFSRIVLVLDPKKNRKTLPRIASEMLQPDSFIISEINEFLELAKHAQKFCQQKCKLLEAKIYEEDVLKETKEYWYEQV
ncbi:TPA: hypothetical protein ACF39K_004589 [Vibrio parahaemolyticus]|uniref:hypothetical protein n=1 Tax=Vibrio TaxID=662 RepID=UPI0007A086FA|nr:MULTISPECIES: hypothetical protein [Vibrio]EIU7615359.1 hypothetical protein [Vibrio vulnificus]EIU7865112.1 hypothetical protein [Vibrio vulnificus]EJE8581683.1 hypothetical protein [Vibrio vulnificus]EJG0412264.1 hypothetical protein [Vibrio parahaemolyticus]ELB2259756.1 hypothetical protein [Vibrio parahaemolyticus]